MKIADWNDTNSFKEAFNQVNISRHNNEFSLDNCLWINNVTNYFGDDEQTILHNILKEFQNNIDYIKCYHGSRYIVPNKIMREGLKKFSPQLVTKLCQQAKIYPNRNQKNAIEKTFNKFLMNSTDKIRSHVYMQIDKYLDMFNIDSNQLNRGCSFFNGSEGLSNILDSELSVPVLKAFREKGLVTVVTIALPFNQNYLSLDKMQSIALHFFTSWYNSIVLKDDGHIPCHQGLNINKNINKRYLMDIQVFH